MKEQAKIYVCCLFKLQDGLTGISRTVPDQGLAWHLNCQANRALPFSLSVDLPPLTCISAQQTVLKCHLFIRNSFVKICFLCLFYSVRCVHVMFFACKCFSALRLFQVSVYTAENMIPLLIFIFGSVRCIFIVPCMQFFLFYLTF